jgi:hypothetical protein
VKDWIAHNWKPIATVAFIVAAYVFVQKYPMTPQQHDVFVTILLASGVAGTFGPGLRAPRREDDPK